MGVPRSATLSDRLRRALPPTAFTAGTVPAPSLHGKFDSSGTYRSSIGSGAGLVFPAGVARDRLGNLYVSSGTSSSSSLFTTFDSAGAFQFSWSIPDVSGFLATAPVAVPEPSTWLMAVAGLAGLRGLCRQSRRQHA